MNKARLYWYCQLGGWTLFNVIEIISYGNILGYHSNLFINGAINLILGVAITHLYRNFLLKTNWLALPLYKLIPRLIWAIAVMTVVLSISNIGLDRFLLPVFQEIPLSFELVMPYFFNFGKYVLLWVLIYHLFQYWERSLKAERDYYQLEAAVKETQYNNLKTQLNPHFLFNSLNSIRTLVDLNPEMAKNAINQLSGLLRSSLHKGNQKTVSLADELQTVKDYIAIETIRFDTRLKFVLQTTEEAMLCMVPPLMLQTLVENAVKHGISASKEGGIINLSAKRLGNHLHISIENTGVYQPKAYHQGVGLVNTIERLKILFDEKASFGISNTANNTVLTEIILPA
jgi:two-component system LytT family sensor kinase